MKRSPSKHVGFVLQLIELQPTELQRARRMGRSEFLGLVDVFFRCDLFSKVSMAFAMSGNGRAR